MATQVIGIVGAETTDNGIVQARIVVGLDVVMVNVSDAVVQEGTATMTGSLGRLIRKEELTETNKAATFARIRGSTSCDDFKRADLVIEVATENFDLKVRTLKQLGATATPHTIAVSNTSSISITELITVLQDAGRFIGMYLFSPASMTVLVEVIHGLQTSDVAHAAIEALAKQLGKTPITIKSSPGFVANHILYPMINEAFCVLGRGLASPEEIGRGVKLGCNHPTGSLALADVISLDTMLAVMEVLYTELGDPRYHSAVLMHEMVAAGYLDRKIGRGVYDYHR